MLPVNQIHSLGRYIASSLSKYAKLYENENGYVETNSQSIQRLSKSRLSNTITQGYTDACIQIALEKSCMIPIPTKWAVPI